MPIEHKEEKLYLCRNGRQRHWKNGYLLYSSVPSSLQSSKLIFIYPIRLRQQRHPGGANEVKKSGEILRSYSKLFQHIQKRGLQPKLQRLEN